MLDRVGKSKFNLTRTYHFGKGREKKSIHLTVRFGVINIAGFNIPMIIMAKEQGEYVYYHQTTCKPIDKYTGLRPKDFILEAVRDNLINLELTFSPA